MQSGQELTQEERSVIEQLKSVRTRLIKEALQGQRKLTGPLGLAEVVSQIRQGTIMRGSDVLLLERERCIRGVLSRLVG
ncbi:MAG: hypothetical protein U1A77_00350 [Pirellulales bacterium]